MGFFSKENIRFAQSRLLTSGMESRSIRYVSGVSSEASNRDEYGSRLLHSRKWDFLDRDGERARAAILVSRAGEEFIIRNHGILKSVDKGLRVLREGRFSKLRNRVDLGRDWRMVSYLHGGFSDTYKLELGPDLVIVKTQRYDYYNKEEKSWGGQPYIYEMLQIQELAAIFKEELKELRMRLPICYFATAFVLCQEFIERGRTFRAGSDLLFARFDLVEEMEDYIREQREGDRSLWRRVYSGLFTRLGGGGLVHKKLSPEDYITDREGYFVCVDPVFRY